MGGVGPRCGAPLGCWPPLAPLAAALGLLEPGGRALSQLNPRKLTRRGASRPNHRPSPSIESSHESSRPRANRLAIAE
eukprot:COSAG04_NODE_740_length_10680_cov_21.169171_2_plen_78_part_00